MPNSPRGESSEPWSLYTLTVSRCLELKWGARWLILVTGMGMEKARHVTEIAMSVPHTICIASGFCGSLKPAHKVGDILAARAVQHLGKSKTIECSRNLFMAAYENQATEAKLFLTTDKVISTAEEKQRLAPFADAVDMESFATLSVAKEKNVSAAAIRVVSD